MHRHIGPKPLLEPKKLKTEANWIEAGRKVFNEADHLHLRTFDAKFVDAVRSRETVIKAHMQPLPDGTIFGPGGVRSPTGLTQTVKA